MTEYTEPSQCGPAYYWDINKLCCMYDWPDE